MDVLSAESKSRSASTGLYVDSTTLKTSSVLFLEPSYIDDVD